MCWVMPGRLFSTEEYLSSSYIWLFKSIKSRQIVFSNLCFDDVPDYVLLCFLIMLQNCIFICSSKTLFFFALKLIWTTFTPPGRWLLLSLLLSLSLYARTYIVSFCSGVLAKMFHWTLRYISLPAK